MLGLTFVPHVCVLGLMLGLMTVRRGHAGPDFCVRRPMLGLISV